MSYRVVEWSTGTVGRHAIAGIDTRPDLQLVGVWVSSDEKVGRDAGELADLGRDLGVVATNDRDALLALKPDCIVHTAMTDDRMFEAIDDLVAFLEAGVNVVSSGPVVLQFPRGVMPDDLVERIEKAGQQGGASLHVNGIDPGWANDVLPLALTSLSQRIDEVRVLRDRRLLHLLPARRDEGDLRLRQAARRGPDAVPARHPLHGMGECRAPDRGRPRRRTR